MRKLMLGLGVAARARRLDRSPRLRRRSRRTTPSPSALNEFNVFPAVAGCTGRARSRSR